MPKKRAKDDLLDAADHLLKKSFKIEHGTLDPKTKKIVIEKDMMKWAEKFEHSERQVDMTEIKIDGVSLTVSTVFLGINQGYYGQPLWFETMVFTASPDLLELTEMILRHETFKQAKKRHLEAVEHVKREARKILAEVKALDKWHEAKEVLEEEEKPKPRATDEEISKFNEALRKL
jgi:DNA repair ATPase RecN